MERFSRAFSVTLLAPLAVPVSGTKQTSRDWGSFGVIMGTLKNNANDKITSVQTDSMLVVPRGGRWVSGGGCRKRAAQGICKVAFCLLPVVLDTWTYMCAKNGKHAQMSECEQNQCDLNKVCGLYHCQCPGHATSFAKRYLCWKLGKWHRSLLILYYSFMLTYWKVKNKAGQSF